MQARSPLPAPLALVLALAPWMLPAAVLAGARPARADEYVVDPAGSSLTVNAYRDGYMSNLGHDHTIAVDGIAGRVDLDRGAPEKSRVALEIAAGSLRVTDAIEDDERAEIKSNMDEDVLEVEDYPTIRFRSVEVEVVDRTDDWLALLVHGDLTLHGRTKRMKLYLEVTLGGDGRTLTASGEASLKQSDYGIEPYSAFMGAVKVQDEVGLVFSIACARRDPAPKPAAGPDPAPGAGGEGGAQR